MQKIKRRIYQAPSWTSQILQQYATREAPLKRLIRYIAIADVDEHHVKAILCEQLYWLIRIDAEMTLTGFHS